MRTRERRHGLNSLLVLIAVSVLFFYSFAHHISSRALFAPGPSSYGPTETIRLIEASDGAKLAVYWAEAPNAKGTVFYFHGNAEDLGDIEFILSNYRLQGLNALSFDYRGYGLSEGAATEKLTYADALEVWDHAVKQWGVDPGKVVLHGRSLGAGVAMELATRRPAAGLILESAFLSAFRVVLPMRWVPGDKFVNARKAAKVRCPTLVVHGRRDGVVPIDHGEELAELMVNAEVRTLWLDDAGHNDLTASSGARYWAAIRGFVASLSL